MSKEENVKWENQYVLDSIEHIVNYTKEKILDRYRKRKKYDVHEKKLSDINN